MADEEPQTAPDRVRRVLLLVPPALKGICTDMVRFLIGIVVALGLVVAPTAAEARAVLAGGGPECAMDRAMPAMPAMPDMPADHSKMACCTIACQVPASAALLPMKGAATLPELGDGMRLAWSATKRLTSLISPGLDPPPRP